MNIYEKLLPDNLYHSYVIEGDPEGASEDLVQYLIKRNIIIKNDPDLFYQKYESLTIDDSREIKEWHSRLPTKSESKKICLISTNFINKEAEQSLLKIIEEPGTSTFFFIVTPDSSVLLNTTRSRVQVVKHKEAFDENLSEIANQIISLPLKDKLEIIASLVKKNKSEESSGPLRRYAINLLNEIEKQIYKNFKNEPKNKNYMFVLEELVKNKNYLNYRGASVKMILEHIAMIV